MFPFPFKFIGLHCSLKLLYKFTFTSIESVLSAFVAIPLRMTETAIAGQLDVLIRRLNEAERRAKLLKHEVKSIRQEISILRQNVGTQNGNASIFSSTLTTTQLLSDSVILLDDEPGTSSVDSLSSYKRPAIDESGPSNKKKSKFEFNKENDYVVVYTDGACENNGKANAKAGIGVYFGDEHPLNVSKPVEGRPTNNTAEIQACVQALKVIKSHGEDKAKILTDSEFTINCMTKWIKNWKKNNWKTASGGSVKNKEDLQILDTIMKTFTDIKWVHVAGHNGIKGNEEADKLARQGALRYKKS
ncbi:ribonuclease H1 [Anoplophora glabripennis]|uniref:ribonuclease H1 n=1 Tax=Anoplophora glabripennis TaxID=217634 RepID=UPI000873BC8F|nr:ribonuclease H1 [Anoplophora glabripennis]